MEQLATPNNNFFHFALSHLPNARSLIETQLSKAALAELDLQTLEGQLSDWIQVIGIYVMTVNEDIDAETYKQTLKSILPTQFELGSLADRLLAQGREEGREKGLEEGERVGMEKGS